MIFGLIVPLSDRVQAWVRQARDRAAKMFVFKMRVGTMKHGESQCIVMEIEPTIPNVTVFGWLTAAALLLVKGWTWWIMPALGVGCLTFFWMPPFYKFMAVQGLRKAGVQREDITVLSPVKLLMISMIKLEGLRWDNRNV